MKKEQTNPLFDGIIESAKQQSVSIIEKGQRDAQQIEESYKEKIAKSVELEKEITTKQLKQIERSVESQSKNIKRRHQVSYTQRLHSLVYEQVVKEFSLLVGTKEYQHTLTTWIAEAAIGLDRKEGVVHCSFKESVDDAMLKEAESIVKQTTGKEVKLTFGGATLTSLGVEVVSIDKKIAYNNQLATRLIRYDRQIKELMEGEPCHKG